MRHGEFLDSFRAPPVMSFWRLILRSFTFHWRLNLAVALGVAAATAALTGALLVGDSMRGSLSELTLSGLGRIDELLLTSHFFRQELAGEAGEAAEFKEHFQLAAPAIVFPRAAIETRGKDQTSRAGGVMVIGCSEAFWQFDRSGQPPAKQPQFEEIVLNQPLADELGAQVGDQVTIRLARPMQTPSDSALGRKSDLAESVVGLVVREILPAEGLGRFSIEPTQRLPLVAYVSLERLQDELEQDERINAIFVSGKQDRPTTIEESEALAAALRPRLADYGYRLERVRRTHPADGGEEVIYDYFNLTTDGLLFPPQADRVIQEALAEWSPQPALTYLANAIRLAKEEGEEDASEPASGGIPYSTISALDPTERLGPYRSAAGEPLAPLGDEAIVLNAWAAEDLSAQPGDAIVVDYFEPETVHGQTRQRSATFRLEAIAPFTTPEGEFRGRREPVYKAPPTQANDPSLTPDVPGVTDQETIENWDPPFPFDQSAIRDEDDLYWKQHRTTPKAFVSLAAGRKLWGSRFGQTTSYRIAYRDGLTEQAIADRLEAALAESKEKLGFEFLPIKRRNLAASRGTTPFDGLFLGFSFFLIAAALMLSAILFRLGVEQRARETGILLGMGLRRRQALTALLAEGLLVSAAGAVIGALAGVGYAWAMLEGLKTLWLDAIVTPFLRLYVTPRSLLIGLASGVIVALATIAWSVWHMRRVSLRRLMSGHASESAELTGRSKRWPALFAAAMLVIAAGLAVLATTRLSGEGQAGAFMGSGAAVLAASLVYLWSRLRRSGAREGSAAAWSLPSLALRNAERNPGRSALSIGLMAAACFLIIAISAFRLEPTDAGVGGFELMGESALPVFEDLDTPEGRDALVPNAPEALEGARAFSLRLLPGENASCLNVMQTSRPRVLGVPQAMVEHFDRPQGPSFDWAATEASSPDEQANPWRLLQREARDGAVPVVIDKNTAMYSMHLYGGVGETFTVDYDADTRVTFRVVGLLANSVLQGSLLVSEEHFQRAFPRISGYNFFLIDVDAEQAGAAAGGESEQARQIAETLESAMTDFGLDLRSTWVTLQGLLAVQNTYLSAFQSLGALGLLLGAAGLATVQLRNVIERRSELALMRAAGFRRSRLAQLVLLENSLLLLGGLAIGVFAAVVAVLPHWLVGGAQAPWRQLLVILALVLAVGLLSSFFAVRAVLRAPLIAALRGE